MTEIVFLGVVMSVVTMMAMIRLVSASSLKKKTSIIGKIGISSAMGLTFFAVPSPAGIAQELRTGWRFTLSRL